VRIIILPVVLYGYERWFVTFRDEPSWAPFKELERICGPKRRHGLAERRKFHNEELHNLHSSPDIIRAISSRRMLWAEHVARVGETRNESKVSVGKFVGRDHVWDLGADRSTVLWRNHWLHSAFLTGDGFITHYYECNWLFTGYIPDAPPITIPIIGYKCFLLCRNTLLSALVLTRHSLLHCLACYFNTGPQRRNSLLL
jgi:hypothetical protein